MAGPRGGNEGGGNKSPKNDVAIALGVIGGVLLLIVGVFIYACCIRCRRKNKEARQNGSYADKNQREMQPPATRERAAHDSYEVEDETDAVGSGLNLNVPVPIVRRSSGYNNKEKSDLQPIVHKIPSNATEMAMEMYSIDEKRLKLGDVIGRGTFALVYSGKLYDKPPLNKSQQVMVKTVHGPECSVKVLKQFVEDGLVLRSFKHPNVHTVLGLVIRNDQPFSVLPAMPGGDLRTYISSTKTHFTVRTLMQMGRQVAEGLKYLAEQAFVHQDIATRNCQVEETGNIRISDNALSQDIFEDDYFIVDELSERPLPIGWMAVETLTQLTYSLETDVWSFGVLMWELLTRGQAPFSDLDAYAIIAYVRTGQRLEQPAVAPEKVYELMRNCWKEDPLKRPSIGKVCETLRTLLKTPTKARTSDYRRVIEDSRISH